MKISSAVASTPGRTPAVPWLATHLRLQGAAVHTDLPRTATGKLHIESFAALVSRERAAPAFRASPADRSQAATINEPSRRSKTCTSAAERAGSSCWIRAFRTGCDISSFHRRMAPKAAFVRRCDQRCGNADCSRRRLPLLFWQVADAEPRRQRQPLRCEREEMLTHNATAWNSGVCSCACAARTHSDTRRRVAADCCIQTRPARDRAICC